MGKNSTLVFILFVVSLLIIGCFDETPIAGPNTPMIVRYDTIRIPTSDMDTTVKLVADTSSYLKNLGTLALVAAEDVKLRKQPDMLAGYYRKLKTGEEIMVFDSVRLAGCDYWAITKAECSAVTVSGESIYLDKCKVVRLVDSFHGDESADCHIEVDYGGLRVKCVVDCRSLVLKPDQNWYKVLCSDSICGWVFGDCDLIKGVGEVDVAALLKRNQQLKNNS